MFTRETILVEESWNWPSSQRKGAFVRPTALGLVSASELQDLEVALARGRLPLDFERKLCRMASGNLTERYVEQNSRLIFSLLVANRQGLFNELGAGERDRLVRLLAYVRKEEDAIPDYQVNGFKDDAQEIRTLEGESQALLKAFKTWRLRHQVPALWLRERAQPAKPRDAACWTWRGQSEASTES